MIRGYSDHAANERTFLAWVRTGIAVIAFGFVIEKFNLFLDAIAQDAAGSAAHRYLLENLSGPFGRYVGLALIFGGLGLLLFATARFLRTGRLLDAPETHVASDARAELILLALLMSVVAGYSVYVLVA
jgi:putative membrane protein